MMSLFLPLTLVLLLLSLFIKWNEAKIKGRIGEKRVSSVLSTLPEGYYPFDNIHLREGGRSTQIDHVVVSPYGIFVIETKNYKGWIYGRRRAEYWTQYIWDEVSPAQPSPTELCPYESTAGATGDTSQSVRADRSLPRQGCTKGVYG